MFLLVFLSLVLVALPYLSVAARVLPKQRRQRRQAKKAPLIRVRLILTSRGGEGITISPARVAPASQRT